MSIVCMYCILDSEILSSQLLPLRLNQPMRACGACIVYSALQNAGLVQLTGLVTELFLSHTWVPFHAHGTKGYSSMHMEQCSIGRSDPKDGILPRVKMCYAQAISAIDTKRCLFGHESQHLSESRDQMIRLLLTAVNVICPSDPIAPSSGGTGS